LLSISKFSFFLLTYTVNLMSICNVTGSGLFICTCEGGLT